jgi:hypothetical protein
MYVLTSVFCCRLPVLQEPLSDWFRARISMASQFTPTPIDHDTSETKTTSCAYCLFKI